MRFTHIPPFQFPTTTIFLDDNHDFLLNFVLQLDENVAYRLFENPMSTLEYINKLKTPSFQNSDSFLNQMYNPNRFAEISVLIVDYAMPGMDGLTLCSKIKQSPIKKILLTGKADEKLALSALNEGLINRYVDKSDLKAAELIITAIQELQYEYFQSIVKNLCASGVYTPLPCLKNSNFIDFFYKLYQTKNIIEFYLIDAAGSFILLDENQKPTFLLVKSQAEKDCIAFEVNGQINYYVVSSSLDSFPFNATDIYSYHSYLEALDAEALLDE